MPVGGAGLRRIQEKRMESLTCSSTRWFLDHFAGVTYRLCYGSELTPFPPSLYLSDIISSHWRTFNSLTYDTEGHCMLGRAFSVSYYDSVRACVGRTGLRNLHTALCLTAADRYPLPSFHHLRRRQGGSTYQDLYWHKSSTSDYAVMD